MNENAVEVLVGKVLRRAAELVEQGWCQHNGALRQGVRVEWNAAEVDAVCLTTAIARADHEVTGAWPAIVAGAYDSVATKAAGQALRRCRPDWTEGGDPIRWNNTPGRTADEVVALLRCAAEHAEAAP